MHDRFVGEAMGEVAADAEQALVTGHREGRAGGGEGEQAKRRGEDHLPWHRRRF